MAISQRVWRAVVALLTMSGLSEGGICRDRLAFTAALQASRALCNCRETDR